MIIIYFSKAFKPQLVISYMIYTFELDEIYFYALKHLLLTFQNLLVY